MINKDNVERLIDKTHDNAVKAIKELNAVNSNKTDLRLRLIEIEMDLLYCQMLLQE